jgi:hypothetical protein
LDKSDRSPAQAKFQLTIGKPLFMILERSKNSGLDGTAKADGQHLCESVGASMNLFERMQSKQ